MEKINKKELKQLFNKIKENNEEAVEDLYNKYNKVIYSIAFSVLKNKEDSEDVVQNVIVKIYNLDKDKLPKEKEATWLYTVTKNEALEFIRKNNKQVELENVYEIEDNNNEIDKIIDKENFNKLISNLTDKEKEIISLKIISNLSFKQIQMLIGEPINTIKWRYYNSLYKLKQLIGNFTTFIITFALGIFTMKNGKKSGDSAMQDVEDKENEEYRNEASSPTLDKDKVQNSIKGDAEIENNIIQEIIHEPVRNTNYVGLGILSISAIFLITTIITLIFLKKYQLKLKVKTSK